MNRVTVLLNLADEERRILTALVELRVMGVDQLRRLLPAGRVRWLQQRELLSRQTGRYSLTPFGYRAGCALRGSVPGRRRPLRSAAMPHAVAVAEAFTCLEEARLAGRLPRLDWLGPAGAGRILGLPRGEELRLLPDAAFSCRPGGPPIFLEVDRGTMALRKLQGKFLEYEWGIGRRPGSILAVLLNGDCRVREVRNLLQERKLDARVLCAPGELVDWAETLP